MNYKLGVIGIGRMGKPIAENLHKAGFDVRIYARRLEVSEEMRSVGVQIAKTPRELGERADIIINILTDTSSTWEVINQGDGLLRGDVKPKIMIDMTTSDPNESVKLGRFLQEKNIEYVDAPITGGVLGAKSRNLILMVGGDEKTFRICKRIFDQIAKKIFYMGKMGNGHYMKLIHNQLSHATFLATCEAVTLGMELGLPIQGIIDVFNEGNARSYATEVRFPRFILSESFDAGASFKTVHKDIGIVLDKARELGLEFPITKATFNYWNYPVSHGQGDDDYTNIFKLIRNICGADRKGTD